MSRNGILTKLDDLCKLPKTNDKSLIENFNREFSRHSYYSCSKSDDLSFVIIHYAGKVIYTAENLLEKNRDSLPLAALELFKTSKNKLLTDIFKDYKESCKLSEWHSHTVILILKFILIFIHSLDVLFNI
jgi:myosin heavy subunit